MFRASAYPLAPISRLMLRRLPALFALVLALASAPPLHAQGLPPTNDALFRPLALPTPNAYRAADGRPGPDYWQQRADYRIAVSLDTLAHRVSGTVTLQYTNNSPQPLGRLWFQMEQNLFAPQSRGASLTPADSRWRGSFADGGYDIGTVAVGTGRAAYTPASLVDDTRMQLTLREPVAARGGTVEVTIPYSFTIPEYGADRMGRLATQRGTVYELAQWFPRIYVYDDVMGWNTLPYLGQGEFYLNFGTYDVGLTVPATMQVVATGTLQNEAEVYTAEQRARLGRMRQSTSRIHLVAPGEVGRTQATPRRTGTQTWRYRAENVRDFAWAASAAFIVDGAAAAIRQDDGSINNVLILSAYPQEGVSTDPANPGWEEATRFGRASIMANSRWFPYPYPVAISVAGVVGGMEYPMLHFSGVNARHTALFGVIDHELAHNWFPMIVASDERRHAWMDEGLGTFMNVFANEYFYNQSDDPTIAGYGQADQTRVIRLTRSEAAADFFRQDYAQDQPILTYPDRIRAQALGWLAYRKPGTGLLILRDAVVGPERFDDAFMQYIRRWAFKHPQPADFFRTIESVTGEDLAWFWRGWFYTTDRYDAALTALAVQDNVATATVENRPGLVFPTTVEFRFTDGSAERVRVPVEAFMQQSTAAARVALGGRTLASAQLDPDELLPDDDRANDARPLR